MPLPVGRRREHEGGGGCSCCLLLLPPARPPFGVDSIRPSSPRHHTNGETRAALDLPPLRLRLARGAGGHAVARSHASHSCSPARAYLLLPLLLRSARGMRESSRRRLYMLLLCSNCIVNQCNMQTSSILLAGIIRSVYKMDYYL